MAGCSTAWGDLMKLSQIFSLWPALMIGLFVGMLASALQVNAVISSGLREAQAMSTTERTNLINDISTASAEKVAGRLEELHSNEITVEKHFTTEIIKPVFTSICATDEYVRLFNESSAAAERALSGHIDGRMPGNPAAPRR